jgi:mRNA interferase MazF
MRAIYRVRLDKPRPAVILTRDSVMHWRERITVAPVTSSVRGFAWEVPVGPQNGLKDASVVNCDDITTVAREDLLEPIGYLSSAQERALADAIAAAFDLDFDPAF